MLYQKFSAIAIILLILIPMATIQPKIATGEIQASQSISSNGVIQQTSVMKFTYIITTSGSDYFKIDGTTGKIDYQTTNATQLINNAIGNLTQDDSILFCGGTYYLDGSILGLGIDGITLVFEDDAKLFVKDGMNAPALYINNCSNWLITGITIDGNAENQAEIISDLETVNINGIQIHNMCDNILVDNAFIYNCRVFGFWAQYHVTNCGVTNSKFLNNGCNGITLGGSEEEYSLYAINNEVAYSSDVGITTYGVGSIISNNYVHDINGTTGFSNSHWGIGVEYGSYHTITQNTIINSDIGIAIYDYEEYYGGQTFDNCVISNNNIQTCDIGIHSSLAHYTLISENIIIDSAEAGIQGIWSYSSITNNVVTGVTSWLSGIYLNSGNFNQITENYVSQCMFGGIILNADCHNNTVSLNHVFDNGYNNTWGMGINIYGNNNYISQNQAFDTRTGAERSQQIGIELQENATGNILVENNVYNNIYRQISDDNVQANTKINNIGYNPVGYITNPISGSYIVDSGNNDKWISATVYTNMGSPKTLYITDGTETTISINGITLAATTPISLDLQPGDTFSITFSTAPIVEVTGH